MRFLDCGFEAQEGIKPLLFRYASSDVGVSVYDNSLNRILYYSMEGSMLGEFDDLGGGVLREEWILPDAIGNVSQTVCATNKEIVVNSVIPLLCVSSSILLAHNEND